MKLNSALGEPIESLTTRIVALVIAACLLVILFVAILRLDTTFGDKIDATVSSPTSIAADLDGADLDGADLDGVSAAPTATSMTSKALDSISFPHSFPQAISIHSDFSMWSTKVAGPNGDSGGPTANRISARLLRLGLSASSRSEVAAVAIGTSIDEVTAPAVASSPAVRVSPPECPVAYTISTGDDWSRLAADINIALDDLLKLNAATVETPIFPDHEICFPEGVSLIPRTSVSTTTPASAEEVRRIIREVWPDDLEDRALEVASRESRFIPTARSGCCYGIFQINWEAHKDWLSSIDVTENSQLYDPFTNARAALALYERAGSWKPWGF